MLCVESCRYELHFAVASTDHAGSVLTVQVSWSEHATDAEEQDEYDVIWRLNFYGLSMRGSARRPTVELRACVLEAVNRHFLPPAGRWTDLEIHAGTDREMNEHDITVRYRARMSPSHLETVRRLMDGISGMLEGILESRGVLPRTA